MESKPTAKSVGSIWLGNPEITNTNVNFTKLDVDFVKSGQINITPEPEGLMPVIILPGLGASWDFSAILGGIEGNNWRIPEFVKTYDNLIDSLENAGYVKDEDLFIFAYDWRKGLNELADELDDFIGELIAAGKIGTDEKIDLIGHSYGGLVARTYGQRIGTGKIDKVVTAGSPHQGIIDSYGIWEGATVWKNVWWQRAALELTTRLNQRPGENKVDTIRRIAPGVRDTLPTFDYLKEMA